MVLLRVEAFGLDRSELHTRLGLAGLDLTFPRLTAYGGGAGNLPGELLSDIASAIHRGELDWPVKVYAMEDIAQAHDDMEHNRVAAKQVVLTRGSR